MSGSMYGAAAGAGVSGVLSLVGGMLQNQYNKSSAYQQAVYDYYLQKDAQSYNTQAQALAEQYTGMNMQQAEWYDQINAEQQWMYNKDLLGAANTYNLQNLGAQFGYNQSLQSQAQDFSAQQAAIQRDYETQMSNTAMQRQVAGMKAAGLNPILGIATQGATTPNVSAPTGTAASVGLPTVGAPSSGLPVISGPAGPSAHSSAASVGLPRMEDVITPAVTSALKGFDLARAFAVSNADIANTQQQTANLAKTGNKIDADIENVAADTKVKQQQAINAGMQPGAISAQIDRDRASADASRSQVPYNQAGAAKFVHSAALDDETAVTQSALAAKYRMEAAQTALESQIKSTYGLPGLPGSQIGVPMSGRFSGDGNWVSPAAPSDMERAAGMAPGVADLLGGVSDSAGRALRVFKLFQH